jgi:hypothetical protein
MYKWKFQSISILLPSHNYDELLETLNTQNTTSFNCSQPHFYEAILGCSLLFFQSA